MNDSLSEIQKVFGQVDREIWIVTAADGDRRGGLVATWVSLASIDPADPMVVIALATNHYTCELVDSGGCFGLHLLAPRQIEIAWNFAVGSGRERGKFASLPFEEKSTGAPIVQECLAWLDCRVIDRHAAADRVLFWGQVVEGLQNGSETPLREQALLAVASEEQKAALKANLKADIELQRPLISAWKAALLG